MERVEFKPRCIQGKEVILPLPPEKATPNLSREEKHELLLAEGDQDEIYNNLLRAYLGLVIHLAKEETDPFDSSLDEKICAGMTGLWKAKRRYRKREEPNPDSAVFLSVKNEIKRAIDGGRRKIPREEKMITSLENSHLLRFLRGKQSFLEERVCSQVSLLQFFEAVTVSYRDYCRECLENARRRVGALEEQLEESLDGNKKRIAHTLKSAKGTLTILEEKNKNVKIGRNLAIFFLRIGGYNFREIGEDFRLHRETTRQIFNEVKEVSLSSPEVLAHLSEITNLPLEEINQKI